MRPLYSKPLVRTHHDRRPRHLANDVLSRRQKPRIGGRQLPCDAPPLRIAKVESLRSRDPEVSVVGNLKRAFMGTLGKTALGVGLDASGDAPKQELLMIDRDSSPKTSRYFPRSWPTVICCKASICWRT